MTAEAVPGVASVRPLNLLDGGDSAEAAAFLRSASRDSIRRQRWRRQRCGRAFEWPGPAAYVFGDLTGDPMTDKVVHRLRAAPVGLTRTQIRELVGGRTPEQRKKDLR
jgi:hypothetical protein